MQIRVGYELQYDLPQPTPMILTLHVHYTRASDLVRPDHMMTTPAVPMAAYRDGFGNWCTRLVAPQGHFSVTADAWSTTRGVPDPVFPVGAAASRAAAARGDAGLPARQPLLRDRPPVGDRLEAVLRRRRSAGRACRRSATSSTTTSRSATSTPARPRPPGRSYDERRGVCRDFAHLAIAFCRCLNIPARYCTGYLGDIGMPPPYGADGLRRLVRGLSRRRVAHVRCAQQHAAHRPRADRARPRRRRRRDHHHLRPQHAAAASASGPTRSRPPSDDAGWLSQDLGPRTSDLGPRRKSQLAGPPRPEAEARGLASGPSISHGDSSGQAIFSGTLLRIVGRRPAGGVSERSWWDGAEA